MPEIPMNKDYQRSEESMKSSEEWWRVTTDSSPRWNADEQMLSATFGEEWTSKPLKVKRKRRRLSIFACDVKDWVSLIATKSGLSLQRSAAGFKVYLRKGVPQALVACGVMVVYSLVVCRTIQA